MTRKTIETASQAVAFFSAAVYFVSLWLPALEYDLNPPNGPVESYYGWTLLLLGWLESLSLSIRGVAWLANPVYYLGLIAMLIRRYGWATVIQIVAIGLASASFAVQSVMIDEGGHEAAVVGLGPGFWLWYSSILISGAASFIFAVMPIGRPDEPIALKDEDFIPIQVVGEDG